MPENESTRTRPIGSRRRRALLVAATTTIALTGGGVAGARLASAAAAGCQVSYTVSSEWQGGFGANVAITNLGDPITSWRLT
ncbi:cellulose binding domain-containing protein [Micromonospora zhanjiangensis]